VSSEEDTKRIIGLYGEMSLAMELHRRGWQVYRAYIDESIDFIIARYYCAKCESFSHQEKRKRLTKKGESKVAVFPTNLCGNCLEDSLEIRTRFIQVKTSEGVETKDGKSREYSFHAKLRSNVDDRSFYVWIALIRENGKPTPHYYIFGHREIKRFDNLKLDSYQKTDNQKKDLKINAEGKVLNKGLKYDYSVFNKEFHNKFEKFEMGDD